MNELNLDKDFLYKRISDGIEINRIISPSNDNKAESHLNANYLLENHNVLDVQFFSHRKYVGRILVLIKRLLRKLLKPILTRQTYFNKNIVEALQQTSVEFSNKIELLQNTMDKKMGINPEFNDQFKLMSEKNNQRLANLEREVVSSQNLIVELKGEMSRIENSFNTQLEYLRELINSSINDIDQKHDSSIKKLQNDIDVSKEKTINIKTGVFNTLADFYEEQNDFQNCYYLLLMALKSAPNDKNIENKIIQIFRILNQK